MATSDVQPDCKYGYCPYKSCVICHKAAAGMPASYPRESSCLDETANREGRMPHDDEVGGPLVW